MSASPESILLFNALPTPHLLLSPALVIEAVSEGFLNATLTARERLVGQYLFDVFPDNPHASDAHGVHTVRASLQQVLATGQPHQLARQPYDLPDPARPGHFVQRYWDAHTAPVFDAQGGVVQLVHASVDVTAEVLAQTRLAESQAAEQHAHAETKRQRRQWEELFWRAPAAICIFDGPEWVYQFVNPRYQAMFPGRALLGKPLVEALPEVADQPLMAILRRVYDTGEPFEAQEVLVPLARTEGGPVEDLYFDLTYLARYNEAGQIDGFVTYAHDVTEQVLARRAREAQQGELQRIFAQAPVGIAVFRGPNHVIEMANDLQLAIWDRPLAEALGKGLFELLPEVAGQGFEEGLAGVLATGAPYEGQDVPASFTRHGVREQIFVSFVHKPLRGADGRIDAVVVVVTDTTEQVRARRQAEALQAALLAAAQRQAQQREELFQVFEQAPAAIALLRGPDHRLEFVNPAYQAFFPGRPLVGQAAAEAAPELRSQGIIALLDRVYQTGEAYYGQETPFTPGPAAGEPAADTRYFDFTYQAYRENGAVAGVTVFAFDVTGQVRARRERDEQQQQLRRLFAQAPMAIVVLRGPQFVIEQANEQAERIWGRTAAEVLGRPHFEALADSAGQGFEELLTGVLESGEAVVVREVPIVLDREHTGQPSTGYYNIIFKPLRDEQQVSGIAVMWTEQTDQVLARQQVQDLNQELTATNEELNESNRQLTRTNVDLDTFVYTASHDLKAPITNIEAILLALREHLTAEVQHNATVAQLLDLLQHTVTRFQLTIAQLTDISKLQLAHVGPAEAVPLAAVLEDVRHDLAPVIAAAGATLTAEVPADLLVSFSPANLRSIVYNLLSNAVKYRDPARPAQVLVRAEQQPQSVVLTVQDNGLGLSEAQQQRLFGLFQRLHTHVEGTGVGLYILKRLVENAGGTIAVHSAPGVGSTFTVTFPA